MNCAGAARITVSFVITFQLMNIFGGMAALIVERQQWTLQRLAVMPVARSTLLAGKILARFCLGLLLALVLASIGGAWWPTDISPKFLQIIGHVSPVAWAMDGFTALTYRGATLEDILVPLAVLLGITVLAFVIAIPRFRYQVD